MRLTSDTMPLASAAIDRAAHHRLDADWLYQAFKASNVLVCLFQNGMPLVQDNGGLLWLGAQAAALRGIGNRLFLGKDKTGAAIFALDMTDLFKLAASPIAGLAEFTEARMAFGAMSAMDANLASTARSLFEWHKAHGFCANCGAASTIQEAGWKRACPSCQREHFPRTDPVAIMLAVRGEQCLLGRQSNWPAGFFSCLAGFIEPGETVEQGAVRELHEEAGIKASAASAEYLFAQPWPFPSSLMIGLIMEADSEEITVDKTELDDARWFSREEARAIIAGSHSEVFAPPEMAVAHHILRVWSERGD
jgi:NAD+ diphosphatase